MEYRTQIDNCKTALASVRLAREKIQTAIDRTSAKGKANPPDTGGVASGKAPARGRSAAISRAPLSGKGAVNSPFPPEPPPPRVAVRHAGAKASFGGKAAAAYMGVLCVCMCIVPVYAQVPG